MMAWFLILKLQIWFQGGAFSSAQFSPLSGCLLISWVFAVFSYLDPRMSNMALMDIRNFAWFGEPGLFYPVPFGNLRTRADLDKQYI